MALMNLFHPAPIALPLFGPNWTSTAPVSPYPMYRSKNAQHPGVGDRVYPLTAVAEHVLEVRPTGRDHYRGVRPQHVIVELVDPCLAGVVDGQELQYLVTGGKVGQIRQQHQVFPAAERAGHHRARRQPPGTKMPTEDN